MRTQSKIFGLLHCSYKLLQNTHFWLSWLALINCLTWWKSYLIYIKDRRLKKHRPFLDKVIWYFPFNTTIFIISFHYLQDRTALLMTIWERSLKSVMLIGSKCLLSNVKNIREDLSKRDMLNFLHLVMAIWQFEKMSTLPKRRDNKRELVVSE